MLISELFKNCLEHIRLGNLAAAHEVADAIHSQELTPASRQLFEQICRKIDYKPPLVQVALTPGQLVPEWVDTGAGVSIVTCAMNRTENLLKALPTWLACSEVTEVVLVDWSSKEPVAIALTAAGIADRRIRIVRVDGEPRWILSYAFNIGFRFAHGASIVKTDADIQLKPDFFNRNPLQPGQFIAGDWRRAAKGQEHINGFFYLARDDLRKIKGFNEYIITYGWDDDDIYERMVESGLERQCVDVESLWHIPHDDALRIGAPEVEAVNAWDELRAQTLYKIRTNRWLAFVAPKWNESRKFVPFRVVEAADGAVRLTRLGDQSPHTLHPSVRADAEYYTALEMLSWKVGPGTYDFSREVITKVLGRKPMAALSLSDLAIEESLSGAELQAKPPYVILRLNYSAESLHGLPGWLVAARRALGEGAGTFVVLTTDAAHVQALQKVVGAAAHVSNDPRVADPQRQQSFNSLWACKTELSNLRNIVLSVDDAMLKPHVPTNSQAPVVAVRRRRLYIDAQHGLGNRLRAYASAAAIAKATDRELVLLWAPDHHCDCVFSDLFAAPDLALISSPYEVPEKGLSRYTYMELEPGAAKCAPIDLDTRDDVLVRSAYVLNHPASSWDRENEELRKLVPSSAVQAQIDRVAIPPGCIAVHVRMEAGIGLDNNSYDSAKNWSRDSHEQIHHWRAKSHYSAFIRRLDRMVAEEPELQIFLATDLPENYLVFQQVFADRLLWLPRQRYDRSTEQIVSALADAILLSRCSLFLGSTWSSFSELAIRLSATYSRIEMSGKDF